MLVRFYALSEVPYWSDLVINVVVVVEDQCVAQYRDMLRHPTSSYTAYRSIIGWERALIMLSSNALCSTAESYGRERRRPYTGTGEALLRTIALCTAEKIW